MNNITLTKPLLIKGKYHIYLYSNTKFVFTDKRKANDFLTKITRGMEQAILFITEEQARLNEYYRLYYLADRDLKFKLKMKDSLEEIDNRLNFMNDRSTSLNFDTIMFSAIVLCLNELNESYTCLMVKAAQRKDALLKRRSSLHLRLLELYTKSFLSLGIKPNKAINHLAII